MQLDSSQTTCDFNLPFMAGPTGGLTASATEFDGSTPDLYTFTWTNGGSVIPLFAPANGTGGVLTSMVTVADSGSYKVVIENDNTGCIDSANISLPFRQNLPTADYVSQINNQFCLNGDAHLIKVT